jgi:hypothetical protein
MNQNIRNSILLPTKGRPDRIIECISAIMNNSIISDINVCINSDDQTIDDYFKNISQLKNDKFIINIHVTSGINMITSLNEVANKVKNKYEFLTFLGDDQIVQTNGWDLKLSIPLENKIGISYPNDLHQGSALPTAIMLNARIVRFLGYFAAPNFQHLYVDNAWLELGKNLNNVNYFENIIVEHKHFTLGKSKIDETYSQTNDLESYEIGLIEFNNYVKKILPKETRKIQFKEFFFFLSQKWEQRKQLKK